MSEQRDHHANDRSRSRLPVSEDWRKISTGLRYRGLEVTLIGDATVGLLAIAGYGTRDELAIGAIGVEHRGSRRVYRLAGARGCMTSAQAAAEAIVRARQVRDASGQSPSQSG